MPADDLLREFCNSDVAGLTGRLISLAITIYPDLPVCYVYNGYVKVTEPSCAMHGGYVTFAWLARFHTCAVVYRTAAHILEDCVPLVAVAAAGQVAVVRCWSGSLVLAKHSAKM